MLTSIGIFNFLFGARIVGFIYALNLLVVAPSSFVSFCIFFFYQHSVETHSACHTAISFPGLTHVSFDINDAIHACNEMRLQI